MAKIYADRVLESSQSVGNQDFILSGAITGYQSFGEVCSIGDIVHYCIEGINGSGFPNGEWEVGEGKYIEDNTLERSYVIASSQSNGRVEFSEGGKVVFLSFSVRDLTDIHSSVGEMSKTLATKSDVGHTHPFSGLTEVPATLSEFGITDVYTKAEVDTKVNDVLPVQNNHIDRFLKTNGKTVEWSDVPPGHHLLEVFTTFRKDNTAINGAYPCDGATFEKDNFTGPDNPFELLLNRKVDVCSFEQFESELAARGACGKFAVDVNNEKFRVPCLPFRERTLVYRNVINGVTVSWYSDGWLEQFAVYNKTANGTVTITLPYAYSDTQYFIDITTPVWSASISDPGTLTAKTVNNFSFTSGAYSANFYVYWKTEGYAAIPDRSIWNVTDRTVFKYYVQLSTKSKEKSVEEYVQNIEDAKSEALTEIDSVSRRMAIGTRFQTSRTDKGAINGAYDCDGREFPEAYFTGNSNPYSLLISGKLHSLPYEQYDALVAERGICPCFGLDTVNKRFKVPKIPIRERTLVYRREDKATGSYVNWYSDGWIEQGGYFSVTANANWVAYRVTFSIPFISDKYTALCAVGYTANTDNGSISAKTPTDCLFALVYNSTGLANWYCHGYGAIPEKSVWNVDDATVFREMVQLANEGGEISIQQYTDQIEIAKNAAIAEVDSVSNRVAIGSVFQTTRTDEGPVNGAYHCNGQEYSEDEFAGSNNPFALLATGKLPSLSYSDYEAKINGKGECPYFALDETNRKFKVPTLPVKERTLVYKSYDSAAGTYVHYYSDGWLEQGGVLDVAKYTAGFVTVTLPFPYNDDKYVVLLTFKFSTYNGAWNLIHHVNAEYVYPDSFVTYLDANGHHKAWKTEGYAPIPAKTLWNVDDAVVFRNMVQLATEGEEVSIETYTDKLEIARNAAIAEVGSAANRVAVGSIFQTIRTDAGPVNGAYACDGTEYTESDFSGNSNPYALLVSGKLPSLSYADYALRLEKDKECPFFALDTDDRKFRVPCIPAKGRTLVYKTYDNVTGSYVNRYSDGWLEQGGMLAWNGTWTKITLAVPFSNANYFVTAGGHRTDTSPYQGFFCFKDWATDSFSVWSSDDTTSNPASMRWTAKGYGTIPDRSIWNVDDVVLFRNRVQLATQGEDISVEIYTSQLEAACNTALASITSLQADSVNEIDGRVNDAVQMATAEATARAEEAKLHAQSSNQHGIPIGTIVMFAAENAPAGYLKADGAMVGRQTYPELFATIGTMYGEGDGETSFNLPDLIDRFAQGSPAPGKKVKAGLPNITGEFAFSRGDTYMWKADKLSGAFTPSTSVNGLFTNSVGSASPTTTVKLDASLSNSVYGDSNTVQPAALTLLPCIKAFDAATDSGLIDMTALANEMAGKIDRMSNGVSVKYITDTYDDGANWYRKWSDGWVEQGGTLPDGSTGALYTLTFIKPFLNASYTAIKNFGWDASNATSAYHVSFFNFTTTSVQTRTYTGVRAVWYACGQGA